MTIKMNVMLLARQAHESMMHDARGFDLWGIETPVRDVQEFCARFAALVAEAEREKCAAIMDAIAHQCRMEDSDCEPFVYAAAAIRARGEK